MREIKFRAWDKENEIMIYPKGILFDGRVVNFSCGMLEAFEGYEIMQYTGLKDKNGKEIYEGDIYKKHNNIYLVIYDNGFKWQEIYDSWLERNVFSDKRRSIMCEVDCSLFIEVIGNIYENPELLEGEE